MKILEEEPPLADECKLPWLLDAFLYPISASGMINLAVFVFLPRLFSFMIGLLARFLSPFLGSGTSYILAFPTVLFYIVFGGYVCYYIAHCVIDSSKGSRRASDVPIANTFDAGDLVSQVILLFGCVAVCFWPVAVYYVFTRRTDVWFWLLSAYGVFFLPMSFLAGVMFDSFDALNPIRIIQSIRSTFVSYCGLVLLFSVLGGFITVVLPRLPLFRFLSTGIRIYLLFVLAHRLGWFYWWHKDKLDWGL
ncbi:MAG: hypothetical protein ACYSYV_10070 [Planctomycetota bacterium]|jgi:hypothetical protein